MSKRLLTAALLLGSATWGGALYAETDSPTMPARQYPPLGATPETGPARSHQPAPDDRIPFPATTTTGIPGTAADTGHAPPTPPRPASSNEDSQTATVLGKLHHDNEKEIEMGKTAEKAGKSKEVRNFGKQLVKDHTTADKKVAALAKEEKIDLAAAGSTSDHLPQPGPEFDRTFAKMMLEDHTEAVKMATSARDTTSDGKLKALLDELIPTLQKHRDTAQRLVDTQTAHAEK